jgi:hypothetical protein
MPINGDPKAILRIPQFEDPTIVARDTKIAGDPCPKTKLKIS